MRRRTKMTALQLKRYIRRILERKSAHVAEPRRIAVTALVDVSACGEV